MESHDDHLAEAIKAGRIPADLDPRRVAMLRFSELLTRHPAKVSRDDIDELRSHGLSDEAIFDLVFVISFSNHMDRIADGLGVELGDNEERLRAKAEATRLRTAQEGKGTA